LAGPLRRSRRGRADVGLLRGPRQPVRHGRRGGGRRRRRGGSPLGASSGRHAAAFRHRCGRRPSLLVLLPQPAHGHPVPARLMLLQSGLLRRPSRLWGAKLH
jgi:hypothetical protein